MTEQANTEGQQPLIEHLLELRNRLLKAVLSVLVVFCGLYYFANDFYLILSEPLRKFLPEGATMIATEVASPFLTPFKLTLVLAVFAAIPYILYQIWSFVAPGLYQHEKRFAFPRPLLDRPGCDLSFSGLKTALLRQRDQLVSEHGGLHPQDISDMCAGFQAAVRDVLVEKSKRALRDSDGITGFALAGGVAANTQLRAALETISSDHGVVFVAPPLALCTDNAAMIAFAGAEKYGEDGADDLTLSARPRWPLDKKAPAALGSGKNGAKA